MGLEVENLAGDVQPTVATTSSTASISAPKPFTFAKRSGFVIPKNKLSGSLVPAFRATKKGGSDSAKEETPIQVLRKTKWGPDLSQDATVRKGRALAYQARLNQISEQLTLGALEVIGNQNNLSMSEVNDGKSSDRQLSAEEMQLLELERREIIGELLKLNPSYKAPVNYRPLLKEEKVPIPIRDYPGYNFFGLLFGPANDTLKRLEKETGAKIQVYGIKADTGGKVEITPSDVKETVNNYEDLYVHVSADTYTKVDAAVALIEFLVTSVSMNPASASTTSAAASDDNGNTQPSQIMPSSVVPPVLRSQGQNQQFAGQPQQGQIPQYPQTWFPTQSNTYSQSGFVTPVSSSSPFNPPNTPSLFGAQPGMAMSFSPGMQNPSPAYSRPPPTNALHQPYVQSAPPLSGQSQLGILPSASGQLSAIGMPHNVRPAIPSFPQPTPLGHNSMVSQNMAFSIPPANVPNNMISPVSGSPHNFSPTAMSQNRGPTPNVTPGPNSFAGSSPNSLTPAIQRPGSGDFSFQPHRPPYASSQPNWQSNQHQPYHSTRPPNQSGQAPLAPQQLPNLPMRPGMHNFDSSPMQGLPRPQPNQPRPQISTNFAGRPPGPPLSPRHPAFLGPNGGLMPSVPHMQPRNFIPPGPIRDPNAPFFPGQGNQMQNHPFGSRPPTGPGPGPGSHQQFGNRSGNVFVGASGVQQTYDPFSPSSAPFNPQMGNAGRARTEADPEYEDLMASVGVK